MVQNNVVVQEDKKYSLKHEWLSNAHAHVEGLKKRLVYRDPSIEEIASKKTITIEFEKFIEIGKFVLEKFGNLPNPDNKEFITLVNHTWPAIALSPKMFKLFKEFHKKNDNYTLIGNSTSLSGEEYLIRIDCGQKLLVDRKTRIELKDEKRSWEIKKTVEERLDQLEKSKLKEWVVYR